MARIRSAVLVAGAAAAALSVAGVAGLAAGTDAARSDARGAPPPPASCPGGVPVAVLDYGRPLDSQEQRDDVCAVRLRGDSVQQVQLTEEHGVVGEVSFAPDGRIAYSAARDDLPTEASRGRPELYVMEPDGSGERQLLAEETDDEDPDWSPDGRRLAYVRHADSDALPSELWTVGSDGRDARRLVASGGLDASPTWSPDSAQIAYVQTSLAQPFDDAQVRVVEADGSGDRLLGLLTGRAEGGAPEDLDWSPDGRSLLVRTNEQLLLMDVASGQTQRAPDPVRRPDSGSPEEAAWTGSGELAVLTARTGGGGRALQVRHLDGRVLIELPIEGGPRDLAIARCATRTGLR